MVAHIRRIEEVNPRLNAAVELFFDSAMDGAKRADERLARGEVDGPLHGVPISVKDSIDIAGVRTTAGTVGRRNAPPALRDATVVTRLRAAGAIPMVKTNLPDLLFAYESDNLIFGRTNNPYDLTRTPGGSSGGESALIAACGSPLGLGSDAAGSVRLPAAFCGIASIKPTSGRLPRTGHVPGPGGWVEALWQIGPMARRVEDLELALSLMAGADGTDFTAVPAEWNAERDLRALHVGVFDYNGFARCDEDVRRVVANAAKSLEEQGVVVSEALPPGIEAAYDLELGLLGADGGAGLDEYAQAEGSQRLHPILLDGFLGRIRPLACSTAELGRLWARWDEYRGQMAAFFSKYDAVVCPVYTKPALLHGTSVEEENFRGFSYTMAWNVAGNPAATVCCGHAGGLPLNVQIVSARWQESLALRVALTLERLKDDSGALPLGLTN